MKIIYAVLVLTVLASLLLWRERPKQLPPDGTEAHLWKITAYTPTGGILEIDGHKQDYWKETSYPRRAFGDSIQYHWFGKPPTLQASDEDGNKWLGKMR